MTSRPGLTDTEVRHEKRRILKLIKEWQGKLWLNQWRLNIEWVENWEDRDLAHDVAACVPGATCYWEYLQADVVFNLSNTAAQCDEDLKHIVIHELLHVVINEVREQELNHEERVVSHLTRIIEELVK